MCDRNYEFCNNQIAEHYSTADTSEENTMELTKKEGEKNRKKAPMTTSCSHCEQFIVGQPQSCNHPSLKKESLGQNVNFHHQTSTMQFPPSFNLRSNQKSTPKRQTCSIQIDPTNFGPSDQNQIKIDPTYFGSSDQNQTYFTQSSPTQSAYSNSNQTEKKSKSEEKKSQIKTKVEVHNNNSDTETEETFHSM